MQRIPDYLEPGFALAAFRLVSGDESLSGAWLLNLPGYRTDGLTAVSCMDCEMENDYCRELFVAGHDVSPRR